MVKLVISDLDGTLLNQDKIVSSFSKEILSKLKKAGIKFCVCTGRPKVAIAGHYEDWGFKSFCDYMIMCNGALIMDNKLNVIYEAPSISVDSLKLISDSLAKYDVQYFTFDDKLYSNKLNDFVKKSSNNNCCEYEIVDETELFKKERIKLGVSFDIKYFDEISELAKLYRAYGLNACFSGASYLEITSNIATKGNGVAKVCEILGISIDDVLAFGDEGNDEDMLTRVGCGVCMLNGNEKIKEIADDVTSFTNKDDGVAKYLLEKII